MTFTDCVNFIDSPIVNPSQDKSRAVNPNKLHYVGICELGDDKDDRIGLIVCSKAMAPRLAALIPKAFKVGKIDWHVTRHPYFSRYPHLRSVKMYLVPRSEIIASGAIAPRH